MACRASNAGETVSSGAGLVMVGVGMLDAGIHRTGVGTLEAISE
jgi:hypothetical protein